MMNIPPILQQMINLPNLRDEAMKSLQNAAPNNPIAKSILENMQAGNDQQAIGILQNAASQYHIDINKIRSMRR